MCYTVMFNIQNPSGRGSKWPEYRWWNEFVERFFTVGQAFEIRCWNENREGIESAQRLGNEISNQETKERVFHGTISEKMIDELHTNYLSEHGTLKWFSIFIHYTSGDILSCEHFGQEIYFSSCDKDMAEEVKVWAMKFECFRKVCIV